MLGHVLSSLGPDLLEGRPGPEPNPRRFEQSHTRGITHVDLDSSSYDPSPTYHGWAVIFFSNDDED
jgi:hypothetical protein